MADLFRRARGSTRGYDVEEVNAFFARAQAIYEGKSPERMTPQDVRTVSFTRVSHGYDSDAVDGALDRLDAAFTRKERAAFIERNGQQAWLDRVVERATTLYDRLSRPAGEKFSPAARGKPGYDKHQVDLLCQRLSDYFNSGKALTSTEVRHSVFAVTRGKKGYAIAPVDAFLDRALEVLVAAE
ncbi:MAG: DivIVA domain-containing protein [Bifidobacteriaceae bacterium]|jgi:DivIVA domain-containing protein|nr:DivIVA domain-containing protein [Bifidobacteriaceae bacterium]